MATIEQKFDLIDAIKGPKLTEDECYSIISDLNEDAHGATWEMWEEADKLADSDNEDDWDAAEELRYEASNVQAIEFREGFQLLDQETQQSILWYEKHSPNCSMIAEFKGWWGEEDDD